MAGRAAAVGAATRKRERRSVTATNVAGTEQPASSSSSSPSSSQPVTAHTAARPVLDGILEPRDARRYIFFGGKGGVGKTTTAAAAGVRCAEAGLTTLIISSDPAHSLGDALRVDLSDGRMRRVDQDLPLYAVESDARDAVNRFRELVGSLGKQTTPSASASPSVSAAARRGRSKAVGGGSSSANGKETGRDAAASTHSDGSSSGSGSGGGSGGGDAWAAVADRLGLQEFSEVLQTIPPGADELIALVAVLDLVDDEKASVQFDRVIIDTAPTGHTLRFLTFPDFLDRFLEQAVSLRTKLASARGLLGNVTRIFTGGRRVNTEEALDAAAERVAAYREKMVQLSDLFRDPTRTEFVVVTIATVLAVTESRRLIDRLWDEGVWVRHAVVNQVLPASDDVKVDRYLAQVRKGQIREISFATEQIADEYGLSVSLVPRFDAEVRGVYGLRALGRVAFREQARPAYGELFQPDAGSSSETGADSGSAAERCKFVFVGGKGGVGKTSMAAAMGVSLADQGFKTLVLSTDPAHSLGDALQTQLDGGVAKPIDGVDAIDGVEGSLFAMEIDTASAIDEFQRLAREYVAEGRRGVGVDVARKLGLEEFASLLDNAPPGIDELVALTQVVELVKYGDFDRVVVDTAPTGHTLRLLSFPEFLDKFLGKVARLKRRLDAGLDALRSVLGRRGSGGADGARAVDGASRGVERLRENMVDLRRLVGDRARTQFAIVTVPTALAMAESQRLVKSLRDDGVYVNNLIINQVVPDASASCYVDRIVAEQAQCIRQFATACTDKRIVVVDVPYFDVEVRGIYGLKAMAAALFSPLYADDGTR